MVQIATAICYLLIALSDCGAECAFCGLRICFCDLRIYLKYFYKKILVLEFLGVGKFGYHDFLGTIVCDGHLHKKIRCKIGIIIIIGE